MDQGWVGEWGLIQVQCYKLSQMSRQWLDIYEKGPQVFNQHILNYKRDEKQTRQFDSEKRILDSEIDHRFNRSTANRQYKFPNKHRCTEDSHNSLISVLEYDLKNQNPTFCSFRRCFESRNRLNQNQSHLNGSGDPETSRSKSRKIMGLNRVKMISKKSLSKSRKKRKVEVREIHLNSTNQQNQKSLFLNPTPSSKKKLITAVKGKSKEHESKNSQSIIIVNKPRDSPLGNSNPLHISMLPEEPGSACQEKSCKSPTNYSSPQRKHQRYLTNRPAPRLRMLIVQKREIKILTSEQFNSRRSKDKSIRAPRDTFHSYKTLEQTKRSLANKF